MGVRGKLFGKSPRKSKENRNDAAISSFDGVGEPKFDSFDNVSNGEFERGGSDELQGSFQRTTEDRTVEQNVSESPSFAFGGSIRGESSASYAGFGHELSIAPSVDFSKWEEERLAAEKMRQEILEAAKAEETDSSNEESSSVAHSESLASDLDVGDSDTGSAAYTGHEKVEAFQPESSINRRSSDEGSEENSAEVNCMLSPSPDFLTDAGPVIDHLYSAPALVTQQTMKLRRAMVSNKLYMVSAVDEPLLLQKTDDDFATRVAALPHNALCIELRDMYRIIGGLAKKGAQGKLTLDDVAMFYEWFEGFFGILSSLYEVLEDVLFSWLEKIGSAKLCAGLTPSRRKKKQDRTKDICWDILGLKIDLQKYTNKKATDDARPLVHEIADEMELLTMRVLSFLQELCKELPGLFSLHFERTERCMIEEAMIRNLRASNPGKFVIGAFTRGVDGPEAREAYLRKVFGTGKKAKKNTGLKEYRRYHQRHCEIANELAVTRGGEHIYTDPNSSLSGPEATGAGNSGLY